MKRNFTKSVVAGKLLFTLLLLVFSIVNGYKDYVQENPRLFITDSTITAVSGAIVAVYMCLNRNRPDVLLQHAFVAGLFFFVFHVCREFSGYFAFTTDGGLNKTQNMSKQERFFKSKPFLILLGILTLVFTMIAFTIRDSPNNSLKFLVETLIVASIFTASDSIVLKNHDVLTSHKIAETFVLFSLGHILLQYGGFYSVLYSR